MNYLNEILSPTARRHVYGILTLALALYGIWQAVEGDWTQFVVSLTTAAVTAMAGGNTNLPQSDEDPIEDEVAHLATVDSPQV